MKHRRIAARPGRFCGLVPDFPRAEFMTMLYKEWGLQCDGPISWHEEERGY